MLRRGALLFTGLLLGLMLAEGALRASYETLPSLAPAKAADFDTEPFATLEGHTGPFSEDKKCHRVRQPGVSPSASVTRSGAGEPPVKLWFTGDSVTRGMGVHPLEAFPEVVADQLAETLGREVVLTNLAYSGAGYCGVLNAVHQHLSAAAPDLVVVVLFSDDLENRAMLRVGGEVVGFPSTVRQPVARRLVRSSYLANLVWFSRIRRAGDPPRRFVGHGGRRDFAEAQQKLEAEVTAAGGVVLRVILPAPGVPFCPPGDDELDRCTWMVSDLDLMADMVEDLDMEAVDLREVWSGFSSAPAIPEELRNHDPGNLPVHPDKSGHIAIADALTPAVAAKLTR